MAVGMVITVPAVFSFASIVMMLIDIGLALADSERLIDPRLGRDGALCRIGYGLPHELNGIDRKIVWFHDHRGAVVLRSEEHTSELQSLMRISYAVFCLKKKKNNTNKTSEHRTEQ